VELFFQDMAMGEGNARELRTKKESDYQGRLLTNKSDLSPGFPVKVQVCDFFQSERLANP
jgi:hypothetical protein